MTPSRWTPAVRMGLSISVATGLYGISFGALAVAAGLSLWQAMALSALMFTGGSQFAFIGVIAAGGAGSAAVGAASLLGVRNAIYGMQMNHMLRPTASGQLAAQEQQRGFWTAGLGVFVLWNACTLLGAWLGDALGDPRQWGLDGAAVAAFLGLLWPRLQQREPMALAVLSGVVTALMIPVLPPGLPILGAAAVGAAWGWWRSASDAGQVQA